MLNPTTGSSPPTICIMFHMKVRNLSSCLCPLVAFSIAKYKMFPVRNFFKSKAPFRDEETVKGSCFFTLGAMFTPPKRPSKLGNGSNLKCFPPPTHHTYTHTHTLGLLGSGLSNHECHQLWLTAAASAYPARGKKFHLKKKSWANWTELRTVKSCNDPNANICSTVKGV